MNVSDARYYINVHENNQNKDTVKPVLTISSEQQSPIYNGQSDAQRINSNSKIKEQPLNNNPFRTTATFLSPKGGGCTYV
jgi:hypothetical protein